MSDVVKWAILAAIIIVAVIALVASPPAQAVLTGSSDIGTQINGLISVAGTYIGVFRNLINNFLSPVARGVLTGLLGYVILKPIILFGYKSITMFIKFIYK